MFGAVTAFTATAGFYGMFTLLTPWDDEGYMLVSLRAFMRGGRLYDEVYSQYGPFWFEAMGSLFGLLGLDITHDNGRLVSLAVWTLTALLCGIAAARAARSVLAGVLVQLLVFRVVWPSMAFEPMHPGGLTCLLLACLALTPLLPPRRAPLQGVLQGALAAALLLVKVNVGVFAALALATGAIPSLIAARQRWLSAFLTVAGALLPFALMASELDQPWARAYALLGALGILGVALVLARNSDATPAARYLAGLGAGALAVGAAIVLIVLGSGSSGSALVEAVLLAPLRQASALTYPPQVPDFVLAIVVPTFVACVLCLWRARRTREPGVGRADLALALARLAAAVALVLSVTGALEPYWPGGFWLAGLAWVAAWRPHGVDDSPALATMRRLVPPLAVLQVLHAYPVAGSQVAWGSFLLVLVGFVCGLDGARQLVAWERSRGGRFSGSRPWPAVVAGTVALALVAGSFGAPLASLWRLHRQLPRLALPGTKLLHVMPDQGQDLHELVKRLRAGCETFVTLPGLNSLYLWTRLEPPTGLNATTWMFLFDAALQERIVARLETIERLCLVRQPELVDSWARSRPLPERPLLDYLQSRFQLHERVGVYELWVRRPAEQSREGK